MNSSIVVVTPPDDFLRDGLRILTYDLTPAQSKLVSDAISKFSDLPPTIIYVAKMTDDPSWIVDKKQKSSIIILNAESEDQTMVGYLASNFNSYYFGVLRSIGEINTSEIFSIENIEQLMEKVIGRQ